MARPIVLCSRFSCVETAGGCLNSQDRESRIIDALTTHHKTSNFSLRFLKANGQFTPSPGIGTQLDSTVSNPTAKKSRARVALPS